MIQFQETLQEVKPLEGWLPEFFNFWRSVTSDKEILSVVKGLTLNTCGKASHTTPRQLNMSKEMKQSTNRKIKQLLQDACIEQIPEIDTSGFESNIFVVPKHDGGYRMILNLKKFNKFLHVKKFKMDQIHDLLNLVKPRDYAVSLDIKSAFAHVSIHKHFRKFLQFRWKRKFYRYKVMPNGLAIAPQVFTRLTRPLVAIARMRGVKLIIYIDDIVIVARTLQECLQHRDLVVYLLENAGFLINWKKSCTNPYHSFHALGFAIDTQNMTIKLTNPKVSKCAQLLANVLKMHKISLRLFAKVIGTCIATFTAFPDG